MRYMVNATLIPRKRAESIEDVDPIQVMSNLIEKGRSIIVLSISFFSISLII